MISPVSSNHQPASFIILSDHTIVQKYLAYYSVSKETLTFTKIGSTKWVVWVPVQKIVPVERYFVCTWVSQRGALEIIDGHWNLNSILPQGNLSFMNYDTAYSKYKRSTVCKASYLAMHYHFFSPDITRYKSEILQRKWLSDKHSHQQTIST